MVILREALEEVNTNPEILNDILDYLGVKISKHFEECI